MDNKEFLDKLKGINPALECLDFLYHRILRDDYRGTHKLQHYRWSAKYIKIVLKNLQSHCDKEGFLYHTAGDIYDDYAYKSEDVFLDDFVGFELCLKFRENARYKIVLQSTMIEYNRKLL